VTIPANNPDRPKAVRDGYEPAPFFFVQTHESGATRVVAAAALLSTIRTAFEALIRILPESVEVLLKVKPENEAGTDSDADAEQVWQRHYGVIAQGALLEALERCDEFVYRDSRNQLCVRDPISFDYIVLDDLGVLYVYSDQPSFRQTLVRLGFEERTDALIDEKGHWTQIPLRGPRTRG
jgi:hypothetical protein